MNKIVYSFVVLSALLLSGCGDDDNNDNNQTQALGTSGVSDRNETTNDTTQEQNEGQSYAFTVLRAHDNDAEKSGKVSYQTASQRCQDTKPDGHPDGGFSLPTLAELTSIDTTQLKTNTGFNFKEVVATERFPALIVWREEAKGYVLYDNDTKDAWETTLFLYPYRRFG